MNVDHLRLFTRVAHTHNISQAADELGVSAAVASNYLNKLEKYLGTRLLQRTTRQISLTDEGAAFLPYAEEVLFGVEAARASVGLGQREPTGNLRITAPASFGRMHLLPHLKGFMAQYPQLHVDFRFSDSIVDLVEGGFDIAIRNAALKNSSYIARKLASDQRVLCASPDYLAAYGEPKRLEDLKDHECITLAGLETWQFLQQGKLISVKAKGRFRSDNGEATREACVQGLGITINSTWSAYQHLQRGELVRVLANYSLASETAIWALYPSLRQLAPKVRAFIDYFKTVYGEQPYWDQPADN